MNVKIIDENNIVVDGFWYEAVDTEGCLGCDIRNEIDFNGVCKKVPCSVYSTIKRKDRRNVAWKKKPQKTTHELFNEWCGDRSSTHVATWKLNCKVSSKQIGLWRKKNGPTPNAKSKAILKKYGFDWDKHADFESDQREIVEEVVKPKKPENFTIEFEYVDIISKFNKCEECYFGLGSNSGCFEKRCKVNDGYIIKRVKNYSPLTRETAMIGQNVRQATENGYLHGEISYIKKHQDQCVVDWGASETTICFASLEVLED